MCVVFGLYVLVVMLDVVVIYDICVICGLRVMFVICVILCSN